MNFNFIKILYLLKITRPVNLVITALVTIVAIIISGNVLPDYEIISLAVCSTLLVAASGNVINDYFDIEVDKINQPMRPLASGKLAPQEVLVFYFLLNILSLVIASFLPQDAFTIVFITLFLLFIYSYRFKGNLLIGNIIVSVCTGLVFIFGSIISGDITQGIMPAIFAFFINMIREIVKDILDIQGDSSAGLKTFPIVFGIKKSKLLILILSILLAASTFIPFIFTFYRIEYFLIVLFLVNLPLIYLNKELLLGSKIDLRVVSNSLKIIMVFGLIAIYLGGM